MVWDTAIRYIALVGIFVCFVLQFQLPKDNLNSKENPLIKQTDGISQPGNTHYVISERSRKKAFISLCVIGCLDNATRTGALTFFPFIMAQKGASASTIGFSLTVLFIGGAAGKLVCGVLAPRLGILKTVAISEIATAFILLCLLITSLQVNYFLLIPLGIALNGTSSILYGTVSDLAKPDQETRAFSVFYTTSLGCGAIMPYFYGVISDHIEIMPTMAIIALMVLIILPLLHPLKILTVLYK
ncbi:MFS transporter [Acerihabitans sp. KWT182]|uniref:MFS transporter n=1 Tax=Acerihabitans sp. KWT182 TaxID=3157919 RepID=A0AAU7QD54_9GAMM